MGQDKNLNQIKKTATSFYIEKFKLSEKTRVSLETINFFNKKSSLFKISHGHMMDVPSQLIAVTADLKVKEINYHNDFKKFSVDLNPIIRNEEINLKDSNAAETHLNQIFSIYGIYKADINCKTIIEQKKYKCFIKNSSPRDFKGEIIVNASGEIEAK